MSHCCGNTTNSAQTSFEDRDKASNVSLIRLSNFNVLQVQSLIQEPIGLALYVSKGGQLSHACVQGGEISANPSENLSPVLQIDDSNLTLKYLRGRKVYCMCGTEKN